MALSIKNPEAERLARELVRATGESLTEAVTRALRDRLVLVRENGRRDQRLLEAVREIQSGSGDYRCSSPGLMTS